VHLHDDFVDVSEMSTPKPITGVTWVLSSSATTSLIANDRRRHHRLPSPQARPARFGRYQPGCRALVDSQYGIGGLLAVVMWSELGDCQRFARSEQDVRHSGLDVTVDSSDRRRAGGFLSRQGPQALRWAL